MCNEPQHCWTNANAQKYTLRREHAGVSPKRSNSLSSFVLLVLQNRHHGHFSLAVQEIFRYAAHGVVQEAFAIGASGLCAVSRVIGAAHAVRLGALHDLRAPLAQG